MLCGGAVSASSRSAFGDSTLAWPSASSASSGTSDYLLHAPDMHLTCHDYWLQGEMVDMLASRRGEEEALCAVCAEGHSVDANVIVFCERCDLAVHQLCYGIEHIPSGERSGLRAHGCATAPLCCPPSQLPSPHLQHFLFLRRRGF